MSVHAWHPILFCCCCVIYMYFVKVYSSGFMTLLSIWLRLTKHRSAFINPQCTWSNKFMYSFKRMVMTNLVTFFLLQTLCLLRFYLNPPKKTVKQICLRKLCFYCWLILKYYLNIFFFYKTVVLFANSFLFLWIFI